MVFWHLGLTAAIVYATLGRRRIDYRVVLLGAVLPDVVDLPLGRLLLREEFQSQHLWGHTLLLPVVLALGVMLLMRGERARRWFVLPMAVLVHLGIDAMWDHPITLYWPLFGTDFPAERLGPWWRSLVAPVQIAKEVAGLGMLLYLGIGHDLQKADRRRAFLRTGKLEGANPGR
jgi:inner membrane protein